VFAASPEIAGVTATWPHHLHLLGWRSPLLKYSHLLWLALPFSGVKIRNLKMLSESQDLESQAVEGVSFDYLRGGLQEWAMPT
jgi:hypothetical protein